MSDHRVSEDDRLDRMLRAIDPVQGRMPVESSVGAAFDSMSALIVSEPRRVARRRRFMNRPRAVLVALVAFVVLSAGGAVAATQLFVSTHTRQYAPKGMVVGGGPGELLNLGGTDFRQVALRISSDIPYPAVYESWRRSVISVEYDQQCPRRPTGRCAWTPRIPAGALHGSFAASAFCAWVLDWRQDMLARRDAAAEADTRVISSALSWKAISAWDPHPTMSVPGDMGTTHPSPFGWMIPFIDAVRGGDPAQVDHAIVDDATHGGQFAW